MIPPQQNLSFRLDSVYSMLGRKVWLEAIVREDLDLCTGSLTIIE